MSDRNQRKSGVILSYVSIIINTLIQFLYTPLLIIECWGKVNMDDVRVLIDPTLLFTKEE